LVLVFSLYLTLTLSSRRGNTPLLLKEKGPGVKVDFHAAKLQPPGRPKVTLSGKLVVQSGNNGM
jgi:hypothetical protein